MDISPDKQNIDRVFSNTTYFIDFYQRHYKWDDQPVQRLLDDVFYKFEEEYSKFKDSDIPLDQLISRYGWYYLNTYVTNKVEGKLFVVDGQQRLTTLTLILIKLMHLAKAAGSDLEDWLKDKIMGRSGFRKEFWMNHVEHKACMTALYDGSSEVDVSSGITAQNMKTNFILISGILEDRLKDTHKLETFIFYFLNRLVLINLNVEHTEVPMVFEVINDRGVKLKPYEILKGKLLGQIDKDELVVLRLNEVWEEQLAKVNAFGDDEIDEFFIYFLKAKLSDTRAVASKFDKDYHRVMFEDEYDKILKLKHNSKGVKHFLQNDFVYYTNLYAKILGYYRENSSQPYVYYNSITEMNSQLLLILSACKLNDPEEDEKILKVSRGLDRLFCLLQLQRSYSSNNLAKSIPKLSTDIRNGASSEIDEVFNRYLIEQLTETRQAPVELLFSYGLFKDTGIDLEKRFKRYFFARIEQFIADNTSMNMRQNLYNLVQNTGHRNGYHIEHILSFNDENKELFNNDPEYFERERNRLGGLLLLKGSDNISSNNESYKRKLKTYANTLYWNETLREDTYKSKLDFDRMRKTYSLDFRPLVTFGPAELEERHKLLFEISKIIWG